MTGVMTNSLRQ